jgi:uncharacterized hydrophobic protein (TIGR00271 family)
MSKEEIPNPQESKISIKEWIADWISSLVDLEKGVDKRGTIQEIKQNISMSGPNAWMLMCSIVIASIGLNMNSPAVIIGAMLISPLMSPILGIGLAVGINDSDLLKKSLMHFSAAIFIAIITSTIYFKFAPFQELTAEIEARTEPTFLDVFIAIFGGVAGIISIARKDISTTLPGVAIATALMPPLCVTGYGVANWELGMASHSFYLFFLNTFFVAIATYVIILYLDFPHKKFVNKTERNKTIIAMTLFSVLTIIPSLIIFQRVYTEFKTEQKIQDFVVEYIGDNQKYLDEYKLMHSDSINRLVLKVYGDVISDDKMDYYMKGLDTKGIKNTTIEIIPTSEIKLDRVQFLESKITGVEKIAAQLQIAKEENIEQEQLVELLEKEVNSRKLDSVEFTTIALDFKTIFPELEELSLAYAQSYDFENYTDKQPILFLDWKKGLSNKTKTVRTNKIREILQRRENLRGIEIISRDDY